MIGEAAPVTISGTVDQAVADAFADAAATGQPAVVLLSPACASFDQFPDFEVRGDAFKAAVLALTTAVPAQAAGSAGVARRLNRSVPRL